MLTGGELLMSALVGSHDPIRLYPAGKPRDHEKAARKQSRLAFKSLGPDLVEVQN